ncbi:unnamed protein product [Pipistrellus nathusii]|uniref:Uncharacterized protein n=1 Tax=Pipistrellus nathusii TaxID=59473 RepID=A0ABN9ZFU0_PIPNA
MTLPWAQLKPNVQGCRCRDQGEPTPQDAAGPSGERGQAPTHSFPKGFCSFSVQFPLQLRPTGAHINNTNAEFHGCSSPGNTEPSMAGGGAADGVSETNQLSGVSWASPGRAMSCQLGSL